MDGYASVKENLGSAVEEQIKYNVEAGGSVMLLAMRDQVSRVSRVWHKVALHKVAKWSDERRERVTSKASEEQKLAWQQQQDARDAWRREVRGPAGMSRLHTAL